MSKKWVYSFKEGDMSMRNLLGGKGANLAEMTSIGLPVPQGFTITTEACTQYYEDGRKINDEIMAQAMAGVKEMEEVNGKKFEVSPTMHGFHYRLYCNGECIFTRANLDTCYSKIIELVEQAAG